LFHISLGILSAAGLTLMHLKIRHYHYEEDSVFKSGHLEQSFNYLKFVFLYIPWMIWQVILASIQVATVVLKPSMPINPFFIFFKTRLPTIGAKVILGNSITMTPGTITMEISGDRFAVHALMDDSAGGIVDDSMPRHVASLYYKEPGAMVYDIEYDRG
jgi:multicomponent Na+:H+ antiporter subunit E